MICPPPERMGAETKNRRRFIQRRLFDFIYESDHPLMPITVSIGNDKTIP